MPRGPKNLTSKQTPEEAAFVPVRMVASLTPTELHKYVEYDTHFPKAEGPPPLKNYTYITSLKDDGHTVTIELDSGAFRAVWELVESQARARWGMNMPSSKAYKRAVESFRAAWRAKNL